MGHDAHFLSRLDRVSASQVELALSLYRDHELVRAILARARLPEGHARVAIALENEPRGPHVIVAHDGHFVTCLGAGMSTGPHPVLPRARLDAVTGEVRALRTAIRRFDDEASLRVLFERLGEVGPALAREDFGELAVVAPLLAEPLFTFSLRLARDLAASRVAHANARVNSRREYARLRSFWRALWVGGHYLTLASTTFPRLLDEFPPEFERGRSLVGLGVFDGGLVGLALRGLAAASRAGQEAIGPAEAYYARVSSTHETLYGGLALLALASRHPERKAGIRAWLGSHTLSRTNEGLELRGAFLQAIETTHEESVSAAQSLGASMWMNATGHLPIGAPYRFARAEDVPHELATAYVLHNQSCFGDPSSETYVPAVDMLTSLAPWIARVSPEETYLPRAALAAVHRPWTPESTLRLIRQFREEPAQPVHVAHVGRNDPCPCGSERKWKRCCAA